MKFEAKKILLIEDNEDIVQIMRGYLVEASNKLFVVEFADCLSKGLERVKRGGIDVILLDLFLPDSQGIDTFTKIHNYVPEVPVIVLTGFDKDGMAHEVVKMGAQDYLLKESVDGEMLVRSIVYAIERHRKLMSFQLMNSKNQQSLTSFFKSLNPFSKFLKKEELINIHPSERFRELIEMERSRSDRYSQSFSLVIFDTNNDDKDSFVSKSIVNLLLKRRLRPTDEIGWFDKLNIGILLHNTGTEGAWHFSEIIRNLISPKHHPPDCSVYTYPSENLEIMAGISIKRNEQRRNIQVPSSVSINHETGENKTVDLVTINVSKKGTFLASDFKLPVGTNICVNMVFPLNELKKIEGEKVLVKAMGKIVRVENKGMAVRFDENYSISSITVENTNDKR